MGGRTRWIRSAVATAALATVAALVPVVPSAAVATPAPPPPQPARVGKPTTMAAFGDSITQATGTGQISDENPKNNWATGTDIDSVRSQLQITTANARNFSANGARMRDVVGQVNNGKSGGSGSVAPMPADTGYVVLEMGGNDLCRDSVGAMTSVADYRTQFRDGLAAIRARAPEALVFVMSVPDVYNLWYIRGAPQNGTYHPEPESGQADGLNGARFYWGQSWFPCQSLLANPDSWSQADRDRRALVRQRNKEFNAVLRDECGKVLRCRFDDDRLFQYTSNRVSPPDGALLPHAQWRFTDQDISRNEGSGTWLCPVQGLIAGGCGDHFHPSKLGQAKLANSAMVASYDFSDVTPPTVGLSASPAPRPDGTSIGPVQVAFSGSDAAGLRGQEVRQHFADGTVTPWSQTVGVHPTITVKAQGVTHVEARSFDVNGNRSASKFLTVDVSPSVPGSPAAVSAAPGDRTVRLAWTAPADTGGLPLLATDVELWSQGPAITAGAVAGAGTSGSVAVVNGRLYKARVAAVNARGRGGWSGFSPGFVAPFPSVGAFLDRSWADLALRRPTAGEASAASADLGSFAATPADVVAGLLHGGAWDGVVAPVVRLYQAYFLRLPDTSGLSHWVARARAGTPIGDISQQFARSQEFRDRYGSLTNAAFVDLVYRNVLGRPGDTAGRSYWIGELDAGRRSRGWVMASFSSSAEYRAVTSTIVDVVLAFLGLVARAPTATEAGTWRGRIDGGAPFTDLVASLLASSAYARRVT